MSIPLLVPCAIVAVGSVPLMLKLVPPNGFYGFRTPQTLANRDLWFRANRFAGCALFVAAGTSAAILTIIPEREEGLVGLAIFIVPLVLAVVASFAYVRRPRL